MSPERPENTTPKLGVPTQPGFYWRKLSDGKTEVVKVGYYAGSDVLCCDYYGIFPVTGFHEDTLFYGPIPQPDFKKLGAAA